MTNKTIKQYFIDWEHEVFGYGYGSGEYPIIKSLKLFFMSVSDRESYDYQLLEADLGAPAAWLLITILIKDDKLDYGTSPRYGFLTKQGSELRRFLKDKTTAELVELICAKTEDTVFCSPTHCNCDTDQPRCTALNPFWRQRW